MTLLTDRSDGHSVSLRVSVGSSSYRRGLFGVQCVKGTCWHGMERSEFVAYFDIGGAVVGVLQEDWNNLGFGSWRKLACDGVSTDFRLESCIR